jgi:hypothetical protein
MEKKTIYYIIGGIAILGIGYYFMNKGEKTGSESKDNAEEVDSDTDIKNGALTDGTTKDGKSIPRFQNPNIEIDKSSTPTSKSLKDDTPSPTKLTKEELNSKLASGCGKKPKLKKNKTKYEQCRTDLKAKLKSQGLIAFDGSYSSQDNIVDGGFYSNFDNGLDLDL